MTRDERDPIRDLLPDWVAGRLKGSRAERVRHEVEADADLQAEAELLRAVADARAAPPEELAVRITAAALRERREAGGAARRGDTSRRSGAPGHGRGGFRAATWVVAAAAGLVLALGSWEIMDRMEGWGAGDADDLVSALESPHTPWVADDGTVAGAAVLDGLTEEALASLLEELGG